MSVAILKQPAASTGAKSGMLLLVVFLIADSFLFRDAISSLLQSWHQEEYSYGYLIPVITLVLLIHKMEDARIVPQSSWMGFFILCACIAVQFFFAMAGIRGILPEVYIVSIIGIFILFLGTKSVPALAGPLLFLMFSAPLPRFLYYSLSFHMQMLSTSLGVGTLEMLGVPVFQDGNIIDLGGYKLQVAEACSGLRYLFPLLSLSYLLAYMYKASFIKRLAVFASALPIAVLMNGLRIAFIGVTVDRWGAQMAQGFIHDFEGWMVFAGCTACLFAEIGIFQHIGRKGALDFECLRIPKLFYIPLSTGKPVYACGVILLAGLATSFLTSMLATDFLKPVPLARPFAVFPLRLGPWVGRFGALDAVSLSRLGTNDYLLADYVKPGSPPVNLYALYYARQDSTSNEVEHTPTVCIPGGGWAITSSASRTVNLSGRATLDVNRVVIMKGSERQVVYYWYVQSGHATLSPYTSRLYMLDTALTQRRTNGAMVRVVTGIAGGESEESADERLAAFLASGLSALNAFMFPQAGRPEAR